ncbi:MAG: mannose-1-phosphate guanylyltransferase/mannose-6-phosphate isomerase [Pseudomonadota bacterium]
MPTTAIQPVIMSGGSGTRLWPLSRAARPKQFRALVTDRTMLQETALRLAGDDKDALTFRAPTAICGAAHAAHIAEQLAAVDLTPSAVILEPTARNTAAVAAVAALHAEATDPDALVLLTPADQHVDDAGEFRRMIALGATAARDGAIVTFGVKPTEPHTGFGYIESGDAIADSVFTVAAFREKPDRETAQRYLDEGGRYWNAGIFLFDPRTMIEELTRHAPDVLDGARAALAAATREGARIALDEAAFAAVRSESVDYAVMEKTARAAVVAPVDVGWSDIGSWTALSTESAPGPDVFALDCANTLIKTDGVFVGAVGLTDMIVVATGDAVLVAPRERAQDVKAIVQALKDKDRKDLL